MFYGDFKSLKSRHRAIRDTLPEELNLRVHRSLSWLQRSESSEDLDICFISLWIGFNAVYASVDLKEDGHTEKSVFRSFLHKILRLDSEKVISNLIWRQYSHAIRVLLNNPYVYQPFWDARQKNIGLPSDAIDIYWKPAFDAELRKVADALTKNDTLSILTTLLSRLYTLRNQIIHGGSTWNSQVNRDQLRDGVRILGSILPSVISVMMDNPSVSWSAPMYPVVSI